MSIEDVWMPETRTYTPIVDLILCILLFLPQMPTLKSKTEMPSTASETSLLHCDSSVLLILEIFLFFNEGSITALLNQGSIPLMEAECLLSEVNSKEEPPSV